MILRLEQQAVHARVDGFSETANVRRDHCIARSHRFDADDGSSFGSAIVEHPRWYDYRGALREQFSSTMRVHISEKSTVDPQFVCESFQRCPFGSVTGDDQ